MPERVIEGQWEELIRREDLRGHRVRVTVVDENTPARAPDQDWLRRLREWAQSRPALSHLVDDSREVIYGGTLDDPR